MTQSDQLTISWLGQAGFLIRAPEASIVIDPYLSDSLAIKYCDKLFKHIRMMPIPLQPGELKNIDFVLSTHRHTDHMDVGTLPELLAANPDCRFIAPKAAADHAANFVGISPEITDLVDAGDHAELCSGVTLDVIPSAHEELATDDNGCHVFLGYIISIGTTTVYHSGDCVPYKGLGDRLKQFDIDVALLPVNGRDARRASNGIPGNFHFDEAVDLCREVGIPKLIVHHFGMFEFNTVDPERLDLPDDLEVIVPACEGGGPSDGSDKSGKRKHPATGKPIAGQTQLLSRHCGIRGEVSRCQVDR